DELARVLTLTLEQVDVFEITVAQVGPEEAGAQVAGGRADVGLVLGDDVTQAVSMGEPADVQVLTGSDAGWETEIVLSVTQAVTDRFSSAGTAVRAGIDLGVAEEDLAMVGQSVGQADPAVTTTEGRTATEQLDEASSMVAGQAGLFLLF